MHCGPKIPHTPFHSENRFLEGYGMPRPHCHFKIGIWRNERLRVQDFLFFSFTKFLNFPLTYIKVQHLILITITSTFRICFQFYKFQTENGRNVWTNIKNTSKTSKNESVKINLITLNANILVKIKLFSYFQSFLA